MLAARESQLRVIMDGVPAPVAISTARALPPRQSDLSPMFRPNCRAVGELRLRDVVGHGIYQSAQAMLSRARR
jgi:hypothetical protein